MKSRQQNLFFIITLVGLIPLLSQAEPSATLPREGDALLMRGHLLEPDLSPISFASQYRERKRLPFYGPAMEILHTNECALTIIDRPKLDIRGESTLKITQQQELGEAIDISEMPPRSGSTLLKLIEKFQADREPLRMAFRRSTSTDLRSDDINDAMAFHRINSDSIEFVEAPANTQDKVIEIQESPITHGARLIVTQTRYLRTEANQRRFQEISAAMGGVYQVFQLGQVIIDFADAVSLKPMRYEIRVVPFRGQVESEYKFAELTFPRKLVDDGSIVPNMMGDFAYVVHSICEADSVSKYNFDPFRRITSSSSGFEKEL